MSLYSDSAARLRTGTIRITNQMFYVGDLLPDAYLRVDADGKIYLSMGGGLLPDMTGQNGKALFTDGVDSFWGTIGGGGDMLKAIYDTNDNGIVDQAAKISGTPGNSKIYTTSAAGVQQWDSQASGFNLAVGTTAGTLAAGDHTHSAYLLIADIDDTPVNGVTNAPISSNWAYDHLAANNPHGIDAADIAAAVPSGKFLRDDGTWQTAITDISGKVTANVAITGATKTKITYDGKGLVTAGADATTADIADSTNKRYVSDAQLTVIGNTSNTNTGDETQSTIKTKLGAATSLADGYLTSADWSTFNSKQSALTFGIADTNKVQINAADVALNDYAQFTSTGLRGRSYAEVLSDIGAAASGHNHTGTYEPANANIQSHISSTSNPHSVTKTQVGLQNVSNDLQIPNNFSGQSAKTTLVDADIFPIDDSQNSYYLKQITWGNIKSSIKTYTDTLYGGGISDGDKGDITVSGSGATWTIDNGVVTEAKLSITNNTTGNVSITAHGFVPIAPNSTTQFLRGDGTWATPAGSGDVSSNTATSVDDEIVLFNATSGKSIKRATLSGVLKATSGVLSAASAGTDYQAPLTFGIADTNKVQINAADVALNDYAQFTSTGLRGRSYAEVLSDIGAQASLGYTAENAANKENTTIDTSTTKYPTVNLLKTGLDAKAAVIHTHAIADVTNLQTSLDGKQTTTLTSGNLLVGNGSNVATSVTPSGDLSMTNAGVFAVNKTRLNVRNETGVQIATTKAVYVSGFNNLPLISLCDNTDETKHNLIGVTVGAINHQANGYVATSGQFDAETAAWAVGTELYMSTSGALTSTLPTAGGVRHIAIVTVQAAYPTGKLLIYTHDEEFIKAVSSGYDYTIRLGDSAGAKKLLIKDYADAQVASVDSDGNATFTSEILNNLTASELVAADANKKIVSLPVATYPSTTELSYVKGVTSAIQTQINSKAASTHTHSPLVPHTVAVQGEIKVPSGGTDYIPGFFVAAPSGQTVKLHSCRYKIYSGTSVTAKIQVNGSDATGFTSLSVTTTAATTTPTSVTLADGDYVQLVPTAVSGTPTHLSFTMFLEYTK